VHIVDAVSVRGKFDSVNPRSSAVEKFCAFVVHLIRPPFPNRFENFSEISIRFILRVFADGHQTPSFPGRAAVCPAAQTSGRRSSDRPAFCGQSATPGFFS